MSVEGTPVKAPLASNRRDGAAHATAELVLVNRGFAVAKLR